MSSKTRPAELVEQLPASPAKRSSGRPRSESAREAVLGAAYAILVDLDLKDFSIDAVALRSGVARTTIYRSWPTKGALAIACLLDAFKPQLTWASTGDAAEDFRTLLGSLSAALSGPAGRIATSAIAQAQGDAETQALFRDQFSEPLRTESAKLLRAGMDAGQFRADLNMPRVLDCAVGAVYLRLLLGQPINAPWTQELGETLLQGCLAQPAVA